MRQKKINFQAKNSNNKIQGKPGVTNLLYFRPQLQKLLELMLESAICRFVVNRYTDGRHVGNKLFSEYILK